MRFASFILLMALLWPAAGAQSHLFDVVRFGSLQEVIAQVGAAEAPTSLVDSYGQDLLIYASNSTTDPQVIRYLVSVGFQVNLATPQGWTPLMYAIRFNSECSIALALLDLGADPSARNSAGESANDLIKDGPNPACLTTQLTALLAPAVAVPTAPPVAPAPPRPPPQTRSCCRYCTTGKACGDSCISRTRNCNQGAGCACNAVVPTDPIVLAGAIEMDQVVAGAGGDCGYLGELYSVTTWSML